MQGEDFKTFLSQKINEFGDNTTENRTKLRNSFFQSIDVLDLKEKIRKYKTLDLASMNYQEIEAALNHVITFSTPTGPSSVLNIYSNEYPIGTRFYRVRQLDKSDTILPLKGMSTISDCWEPPREYVGKGRLNKSQESLLYVSSSPNTAIEELEIANGERCSIIVYEAASNIKINGLHFPRNLDKMTIESERVIHEFLSNEFSCSIKACTGHVYTVSEIITKMFAIPQEEQDAWCYESVAKKNNYNLCIFPPASKKLKLIGVQIAIVERNPRKNIYEYTVNVICTNSEGNKKLDYYSVGSPKQKEIFPEMIIERFPNMDALRALGVQQGSD